MGDFDQLDQKDPKSGKKKDKGSSLPPGKVAGTDNYGQGGNGATPPVPGKQSAAQNLPAGTNGQTEDGKDKGVAKAASQGSGQDKGVDTNHNADGGLNAKGPGKGDGKAGPGTKKDSKDAQGKAKAPGAKDDKGVDAKAKGKETGALHDSKPAQGPQRVDSTPPSAIPQFTLDTPRVNKNLNDQWIRDTGRSVEQHHSQIVQSLGELQNEVQAKQTELMSLVDTEINKVTADITAKVDTFKSTLIGPGKVRVDKAYSGLTKSFDTAEQKANADITKHKTAGKTAIDTAKKTSGDGISKKLGAAKATVEATVAKNVPTASAAIKKWAGGIPNWITAAKTLAKTSTEEIAKEHDPKKGSTASLETGLVALENDVKKNLVTKHGEKLGKQYETSLLGWSKDTDKKADELVRKSLDQSKVEFEAALDTADKASKKGFDDGFKGANTTLDTAETTAKKSVTDAKTNGTKKFEDEKKSAADAVDKAGKELTDNATAAGTELTDRIKKKSSDDAKNYSLLVADLQKQLKSGKPMKFEQVKPKIEKAKEDLAKLHQTNTEELAKFVTDGKTTLATTLGKQQETYDKAIKDREDSAKKTEADIVKDIGKGAETMGTSISTVGKTFSDVTDKESKRIDAMVAEFNKNADTALKDFGPKITQHLEDSRTKLEDNLKLNVKKETIEQDVLQGVDKEIAGKKKSLDGDTQTLRNAMDGWGTDENKIYGVLRKCSYGEITYLEASYNKNFSQRNKNGKGALRCDFEDEMGGKELDTAIAYLDHNRTLAIKLELADSHHWWNDDEPRIEEIMRSCNEDEIKFLNTDPEAIKVVNDVKGCLGGSDLDMMNNLLDTSMDKDDRKLKADAIALFQTMEGVGTDEAKLKKILSECKTEEERQKMRAYFNEYAKSKGWQTTNAAGEDALTIAIKDDVGTGLLGDSKGEQNTYLALAEIKRDEDDIKAAKMVDAADGAGTNEDQIFEALDDEAYAAKWAAATPEERKKLEAARKKMLDEKINKMSGGKWKSADGLIDDEMDKAAFTWEEFKAGKREDGTPLTAEEKAKVYDERPAVNRLQWMVAQCKLQTGTAPPELMLAYACWGVVGTDEDTIKKTLGNGGEPKAQKDVKAICDAFEARWNKKLVSHLELANLTLGEPKSGVLVDELSGKDWFSVRVLLMGKPETAEQLKYVSDAKGKFNKGGKIANALMTVGEAIGYTDAKSDMEAGEARFNKEYQEKFGKNPSAKLGTADTKELEQLADYLAGNYEAYSASLNALVDGIVTALEIIGGVIITVLTAGTASPVLAAIIANLVLSAGTIALKYAALGDQYGAAELGADVVKAIGTSAFAGIGELKALKSLTENVGKGAVKGIEKLANMAPAAATKAGMKLGADGALHMGEAASKKVMGIVAAGSKNVILGAGQEVYTTLTDEKTYEKKLGDVLWGEDSLGAKILKGIPKNFAEGAVTQWINDAAGTTTKDGPGKMPGAVKNSLTNAIAEMGGATAGFFVYLDNYKDAEQFWIMLLKANANKAISGAMNGYAMHKTRAKRLARDFINNEEHANAAHLHDMLKSMDANEVAELAKFVEKYAPEKVAGLPDEYKQHLTKKPAPAATANTATPANTNTPPPPTTQNEPKKEEPAPVVAKTNTDEEQQKQAAAKKKAEDEQAAANKQKPANEEEKKTAKDESQVEAEQKQTKADDEEKKNKQAQTDEEKHDEAKKKKQQDEETQKQALKDEEAKKAAAKQQQGEDEGQLLDTEEGHEQTAEEKRREKRRKKEESEEKKQQLLDDIEDAQEAHKEGDAKRKEKKEKRREEKKKKAQEEKRLAELVDLSEQAHAQYAPKIEEAKATLKAIVGDLGEVQGRAKDPESAANRLKRAEDNFGAKITDVASAKDNIWDALGTRIVVSGNPKEMAEVMQRIAKAVQDGKFEVVKAASNHGEGVGTYLSQSDLDMINAAAGGKADTVNGVKTAPADKSAFTSGLIFVKYPDGTRGEIQIIGKKVLEVAAIEHIPYDVSIGKPLARGMDDAHMAQMKSITGPVEEAIQALNKDPAKKAAYDQYLRDLYKHARDSELGIESPEPKLPAGIDQSLSKEGLQHINQQVESLKAKAKAEKEQNEKKSAANPDEKKDDQSKSTKSGALGDDKDDGGKPKTKGDGDTWSDDEKQLKKPKPETEEEADARRSQPVKPSSKDTDTTHWATPEDRKGIPDNIPLSRKELRALLAQQYEGVIAKYAGKTPKDSPEFHDLIQRLKAEPPGSLGKTPEGKAKAKAYLDEWIAISGKLEKESGVSQKDLRTLYNKVEKEDFVAWQATLAGLPKEQQAKLAHMWREEWRIYVRDLMGDQASTEVLYLRDLAVSGDRRGPRFDDLLKKNLASNDGDTDKAYDGIISSSQQGNKDVNKGITGNESGINAEDAAKIEALKKKQAADEKKTDAKTDDKQDDTKSGASTGQKKKAEELHELKPGPEHDARVQAAKAKLDEAGAQKFDELHRAAENDAQRTLLNKALAAGHSIDEIHGLALQMQGMSPEAVHNTFTGQGVIQFYQQTCVVASYQIAIADVDPVYAMKLRANPKLVMQEQKDVVTSKGGAATKRKDLIPGKEDKLAGPVKAQIADDPEMSQVAQDPNSYHHQGDTAGIEATTMADSKLHKQLEAATGAQYEVITNDALSFSKPGQGQYSGNAPHARIAAAVDAGLPVMFGTGGHQQTIIGKEIAADGKIHYIVRDPASGTTTKLPAEFIDMLGSQSITVPKLPANAGAVDGASVAGGSSATAGSTKTGGLPPDGDRAKAILDKLEQTNPHVAKRLKDSKFDEHIAGSPNVMTWLENGGDAQTLQHFASKSQLPIETAIPLIEKLLFHSPNSDIRELGKAAVKLCNLTTKNCSDAEAIAAAIDLTSLPRYKDKPELAADHLRGLLGDNIELKVAMSELVNGAAVSAEPAERNGLIPDLKLKTAEGKTIAREMIAVGFDAQTPKDADAAKGAKDLANLVSKAVRDKGIKFARPTVDDFDSQEIVIQIRHTKEGFDYDQFISDQLLRDAIERGLAHKDLKEALEERAAAGKHAKKPDRVVVYDSAGNKRFEWP